MYFSHVMNSPMLSAASRQSRPVTPHHRRNSAIPPAYASVVDSARSRPNLSSRRYRSAAGTTFIASSSTVQYRLPDGICTRNARNRRPPRISLTSNKTRQNYTPKDKSQNRLAESSCNITLRSRVPYRTFSLPGPNR